MIRLHSICVLTLLAFAGGCAGSRAPGALSPIGARVTNEVLAEDALTFEAWSQRVAALEQSGQPGPGRRAEQRTYAAARASAWLGYARESYAWDPRDATADRALDETRRIVIALEGDTLPELGTLPMAGDSRARPDLWLALDRARAGSAERSAPAALAGAEVALVRASRLSSDAAADAMRARPLSDFERACELLQQVATAERLIASLGTREPEQVVTLAGMRPASPAPMPLVVPAPREIPALVPTVATAPRTVPADDGRRPLQRVVHFAVSSSTLALSSRVTLGEVIAILRSHPRVSLVIEGYTDARGNEVTNRDLAVRRAEAVRRFLDRAQLDLGRVTLAGIGTDSTARSNVSAERRARDRRVTLALTGPDGRPLTVAAYRALDMDHGRDLQVEQGVRRRLRASRPMADSAGRPSIPPRVTP